MLKLLVALIPYLPPAHRGYYQRKNFKLFLAFAWAGVLK